MKNVKIKIIWAFQENDLQTKINRAIEQLDVVDVKLATTGVNQFNSLVMHALIIYRNEEGESNGR